MTADGYSGDDADPTPAQRVAAALTLAQGNPSPLAEDMLEDRRLALRWMLPLGLVGFALFAAIVLSLVVERSSDVLATGARVALTSVALAIALVGGLRRWGVDRSRLQRRSADAALTRRERLLLLGGIHRGSQANRTPLALLRELARWRVEAARADTFLMGGLALAWASQSLSGSPNRLWYLVFVAIVAGAIWWGTERDVRRCRRFLADSATWTDDTQS